MVPLYLVVILKKTFTIDFVALKVLTKCFLSLSDENREKLLREQDGRVLAHLIALTASSNNTEIQYNCAGTIGQLSLAGNYLKHS